MITIIIFTAIFIVYIVCVRRKEQHQTSQQSTHFELFDENEDKLREYLLDLDATTIAERQRFYGRGFQLQQRYDILQRQAELNGDTATLEAIRTNTYNGPLPELEHEKTEPTIQNLQYFCIKNKGYHVSVWPKDNRVGEVVEFDIAGMSYRDNIDNYLGENVGTLEAEPDNDYDPFAIKILAGDGHHVGYVPQSMTVAIRRFTNLPCKCYFYIGENNGIYFSDCYIS